MPRRLCAAFTLTSLFALAAIPAQAQVRSLGKGWHLDAAGALTSAPGEVISGRNSIRGSSPGTRPFESFLFTDPNFVRFVAGATYTVTLQYRIVASGPQGLEMSFFSGAGSQAGYFVPGLLVRGAGGASGTATQTFTLGPYADYSFGLKISDSGTFVVDDIRIADREGRLIAAENAEGPTIIPGPLNFQLTDAIALQVEAGATVISAHAKDLDGDRYPETILTVTNATDPTRVSAFEPLIVESSAALRLATAEFFPTGAPKVKNSPVTAFGDLNGDGLEDIVFAEAGLDFPPWTGGRIGVALNLGGGKYRDVSALVPANQQQNRAAAIAVGDVSGDGRVGIILPDSATDGHNTAVLRWNGNGFDEDRNWVPAGLWSYPGNLFTTHGMALADFDGDGKQDLLAGANFSEPTLRILFGSSQGFANTTAAHLVTLPDGPFGHAGSGPFPPELSVRQGSEVDPVVVADFNNDGRPDIFAGEARMREFKPGVFNDRNYPGWEHIFANGGVVVDDWALQVFVNRGGRTFVDMTNRATAPVLPLRWYSSLIPIDVNNDGFLDIVGLYQTKLYAGVERYWGTTLFLNDGTGAFQVVDGMDSLVSVATTPPDGRRWNLGAFIPTRITPDRFEGVVYESLGGCVAGSCSTQGLNLYKVVANGAIGGVPPPTACTGSPSAPSGVTGAVVNGVASASWTPVPGATSYLLQAGSGPGTSDVFNGSVGAAVTVSAPVPAGFTAYVRVYAVNACGQSAASTEILVR